MLTRVIPLMFVLASVPFNSSAESVEDITQSLSGRWSIDSGINQGTPLTPAEVTDTFAIITPKVITTFDSQEKEVYKASYTIDTGSSPMQIDMVATRGGQQVKSLGIIRFEPMNENKQKQITLAYSLDPSERPRTFDSPQGSKVMVFEMSSNLPVPKK